MTNGGLYIPMPEHINSLCLTVRFGQCHHYIQGCAAVRDVAGKLDFINDTSRRRYRRVSARVPLQLADCGHGGRCAEILDDGAFTVDLSLGGIRLESRLELPVQKKIAFVFGHKDATVPSWDGQGEVRWTEKLETGAFQSGLIVTDKKTFEAIGHHLSLSSLQP